MSLLSETEPFIPISRFALLDALKSQTDEKFADDYPTFLTHLSAWRHLQYRKKLHHFKELYLPFSPDRDTLSILQYDAKTRAEMQQTLIQELSQVLEHANFSAITEEDLSEIFSTQSEYGLELKVDLSEFENVLLYARGSQIKTQERRTLKSLFLKKERYDVPIFQRLFLLLKLKPEATRLQELMAEHNINEKKAQKRLKKARDMLPEQISSDHIYLKIFKEIPQVDLEMLFPNTQVKLKPFDKLKLGVTAGGGTAGSIFGTITKLATAANPMTIAGLFIGLAAVIFRQVTKFFTQRTKYMMVLAQNLYFHNLANNRGVLTLMADRAEEEAIKENILLYHFLAHSESPLTREQVKQNIEAYMSENFQVKIDFDLEHSLKTLMSDGLVSEDTDGDLQALSPVEAISHIESLWINALSQ